MSGYLFRSSKIKAAKSQSNEGVGEKLDEIGKGVTARITNESSPLSTKVAGAKLLARRSLNSEDSPLRLSVSDELKPSDMPQLNLKKRSATHLPAQTFVPLLPTLGAFEDQKLNDGEMSPTGSNNSLSPRIGGSSSSPNVSANISKSPRKPERFKLSKSHSSHTSISESGNLTSSIS